MAGDLVVSAAASPAFVGKVVVGWMLLAMRKLPSALNLEDDGEVFNVRMGFFLVNNYALNLHFLGSIPSHCVQTRYLCTQHSDLLAILNIDKCNIML